MASYSGDLSEEEQATRAREERQQIVLRSRMIKNYDFQNLFYAPISSRKTQGKWLLNYSKAPTD